MPPRNDAAPGLSEPGHPQHHQFRVDLSQPVRTQTPLLQHARPEVLDEHVGVGDKFPQNSLTRRTSEIQRHASLVARDDLPPQTVAVLARAM
jgi:hypothetical protein